MACTFREDRFTSELLRAPLMCEILIQPRNKTKSKLIAAKDVALSKHTWADNIAH